MRLALIIKDVHYIEDGNLQLKDSDREYGGDLGVDSSAY